MSYIIDDGSVVCLYDEKGDLYSCCYFKLAVHEGERWRSRGIFFAGWRVGTLQRLGQGVVWGRTANQSPPTAHPGLATAFNPA